jgi:hypothetical protein
MEYYHHGKLGQTDIFRHGKTRNFHVEIAACTSPAKQ